MKTHRPKSGPPRPTPTPSPEGDDAGWNSFALDDLDEDLDQDGSGGSTQDTSRTNAPPQWPGDGTPDVPESPEVQEKTDEEIDAELANVSDEAEQKTEEGDVEEEETEEEEEDVEEGEEEEGGEGTDVSETSAEGGEGGGGIPSGGPAPWEEIAPSIDWDAELAQVDTFQPGEPGRVAAEAGSSPPSRTDLVLNALAGGAVDGFFGGVQAIAVDTLMNAAGSKIPYLAGFVEMGKLVMDPAGWAEGTLNGLTGNGKFGMAFERFATGNPIEIITGILDLGDGINSIIGTLSNICWLVAGLGFVLSWIPGMQWLIPFVALAAKWATLLGTISTAVGLVLSVLRALVMGLQTIDILFLESDPEMLELKAEELRAQTTQFTQEYTQRRGATLRENIQGRMRGDSSGAEAQRNTEQVPRPTRTERALSIITGANTNSVRDNMNVLGADRSRLIESNGKNDGALGQVRDLAGLTRQTAAGGQTTGDRVANLERNDVHVFTSRRHQENLERRGVKRIVRDEDGNERRGATRRQWHSATRGARDRYSETAKNRGRGLRGLDLTGSGADGGYLYGHNQGAGVTGSLTDPVSGAVDDATGGGLVGLGRHMFGIDAPRDQEDRYADYQQALGRDDASAAQGGGEEASVEPATVVAPAVESAQASLPAPPLHLPALVDATAFAHEELLVDLDQAQATAAVLTGTKSEASAQVATMQATTEMAAAGHEGTTAFDESAQELRGKQEELATEATSTAGEGTRGQSEAGRSTGMVAGFANKFLDLMSRIPSRFVGNAGEGSQGTQQLTEIGPQMTDATATATAVGQGATEEAATRQATTEASRAQAQTADEELSALESQVAADEAQATSGIEELDQADEQNTTFIENLESELARMEAEHAAHVAEAATWVTAHRSARTAGEAQIGAAVDEVEVAA